MNKPDQRYLEYLDMLESHRRYRTSRWARWTTVICVEAYVLIKHEVVSDAQVSGLEWIATMIGILPPIAGLLPMTFYFIMAAFDFLETRHNRKKWISGAIWAALAIFSYNFYLYGTLGGHLTRYLRHPSWYFDPYGQNMTPRYDFRLLALGLLLFLLTPLVIAVTSRRRSSF